MNDIFGHRYHAVYPRRWKRDPAAPGRESEPPDAMFLCQERARIYCSCWPDGEIRTVDVGNDTILTTQEINPPEP